MALQGICRSWANSINEEVIVNTAKLIGILVLVILLGIVFIQNLEPVGVHFLFITIEMPHILLLLFTAAGGFALGLLTALLNRSGKGKKDQ